MVINYFNIKRISVLPAKANAPLIVDSNAPLAAPVALERFEAVLGRNAQIIETACDIQLQQFTQRNAFNVPETGNCLASKKRLGVAALK